MWYSVLGFCLKAKFTLKTKKQMHILQLSWACKALEPSHPGGTGRVSGKAPLVLTVLYRHCAGGSGVKSTLQVLWQCCPLISIAGAVLGAGYTLLPHCPKDTAFRTFFSILQAHRPSVKVLGLSHWRGALQALLIALKCLQSNFSVKGVLHPQSADRRCKVHAPSDCE